MSIAYFNDIQLMYSYETVRRNEPESCSGEMAAELRKIIIAGVEIAGDIVSPEASKVVNRRLSVKSIKRAH